LLFPARGPDGQVTAEEESCRNSDDRPIRRSVRIPKGRLVWASGQLFLRPNVLVKEGAVACGVGRSREV
jgi:hypothetical protein